MRPFLLISTRADDALAEDELRAVLSLTGLPPERVRQWRLERDLFPGPPDDAWLASHAGFLLGGSPFTSSDPDRSPTQVRVEEQLEQLLAVVLARDLPFLGMCYGVGMLARVAGGVIDRAHAEPVGVTRVSLTEAAATDPLLRDVPASFDAFVGHKEATSRLPDGAVLLAGSDACPVQMYRMGEHVYATQFHPELDGAGLALRVDAYRDHGYFDPSEVDALTRLAHAADVGHAHTVLRNFVQRYGA